MRIRITAALPGLGVMGLAGEHLEGDVEVVRWFAQILIAEGRAVALPDLPAVVRHADPVADHRDPSPKGRRR